MTSATLETYSIASVLEAPALDVSADMIVRDVKVFRIGSFKNSKGTRNEWTAPRLQRAVDNFNSLRRSRIFPDVPVRLDHTQSMRDVVGYFHELRFDGTYLYADILFTKRSAYDEYNAGHLRNVSLEIGQYETNDEVLYDDVVQGLAFVDIPAVEGLHQRPTGEVIDMGTKNETPETPVEDEPVTPVEPETPEPQPEEEEETEEAAAVADHRAPTPVQTFRVNGILLADSTAVQSHIDALEKFRNDTRMTLRHEFVDDLARRDVIGNPQVEAFKAHVDSLSDEQFTAFRLLHESAPANNLFAKHDTTTSPKLVQQQDDIEALAIAEETIAQFRRMNRDEAFIQKQPAWAIVQAAKATATN